MEEAIFLDERDDFELLRKLSLGFLIIDSTCKVKKVNKSFLEMFDLEEGEILNKNFFNFIPSSVSQGFSRYLDENSDAFSMEMDIFLKGVVVSCICRATELSNNYTACTFCDITSYVDERRTLANQLRESQKMEAIGVRTSGIAHDFNNLLTPLRGRFDLIRLITRDYEDVALAGALNGAAKAIDAVTKMVSTILPSGKPRHVDYSLINVVEVVESSFKILPVPKNVKIELNLNIDRECYVRGDRIDLLRVVFNLCTNSVQAIGEKKGTIRINGSTVVTVDCKNEVSKNNPRTATKNASTYQCNCRSNYHKSRQTIQINRNF